MDQANVSSSSLSFVSSYDDGGRDDKTHGHDEYDDDKEDMETTKVHDADVDD